MKGVGMAAPVKLLTVLHFQRTKGVQAHIPVRGLPGVLPGGGLTLSRLLRVLLFRKYMSSS